MDKALGCMMGVLVGDACGAKLEFLQKFDNDDVTDAMHMSGGGALNIGKGQVTDDGELTLALAHSLTGQTCYPMNTVAKSYNTWINSMPFDVGATCRKAFAIQGNHTGSYSDRLIHNAAKYNMLSEANGALMRCSPIAVWAAHRESDEVITAYAKLDAMLSHPNQVCLECNAIYTLALAQLIKNNSASVAFAHVSDYVDTKVNNDKVVDWFFTDRHEITDAKRNIGHVKHAFCMAMNFLENPVEYEVGIRHVLRLGGDTDTNAAICGGILGAINGYDDIPDYMKNPVLSYKYDPNSLIGYDRPSLYHPKSVLGWVEQLYTV